MDIPLTMKMSHVIEIYDHDTNKTEFLLMKNNKWIKISEQEYNKIRGIK